MSVKNNNQLNDNSDFNGWMSRESAIHLKQKSEDGSFPAIATTEAPALVVDWGRWEIVREILLMDGCMLPAKKQAPLLDCHSRYALSDIVGSARNLRVEGQDLICDVVLWSGATEEKSKIEEGHLTDLSAGYKTFDNETIVLKPGEKTEYKGRTYINNYDDKKTLLIRTKWELKEVSLVPIGADSAAKFKSEQQPKITAADPSIQALIDQAVSKALENNSENLNKRSDITMDEKTTPQGLTPEQRQQEFERTDGIEKIAARLKGNYKGDMDQLKKKAMQEGWTAEKFNWEVFQNFDESKAVETPASVVDASKSDVEKFDICRAINALSELKTNPAEWDKLGVEREMIDEATKRGIAIVGGHGGKFIPGEIIKKMMEVSFGKRTTLNVGENSQGGYLVGTQHLGSQFIDLPRNRPVALDLGVRYLSGVKQNIEIPKQLTAGTFAWGAENFNAAQSNLTLGQVTASPKEGKASQTYGKRLFLQSDPDAQMIVMNDLMAISKIGLDSAVFHGAGGNAPTGVVSVSGVGSFNGANISYLDILEAESDIAVANLDQGSLKWALSPVGRAILKGRERMQGVDGYLMERDGTINNYASHVSNQISNSHLMFGNWSYTWLIDWLLYEVLVNPYKDESGNVTITIFVYADVVQQIASALTIADDLS